MKIFRIIVPMISLIIVIILGCLIGSVLAWASIKLLDLYKQPARFVTITEIVDNPDCGYLSNYKDKKPLMTIFSDGGGVCGYVAPVGVVVDGRFLRALDKQKLESKINHG